MKEQQREAEKNAKLQISYREGLWKHVSEAVHLQMFEYDLEYVDTLEIPLFIPTKIAGWINMYKEIARCSSIFPAFENIAIPEKFRQHISYIHRFEKKLRIFNFFW